MSEQQVRRIAIEFAERINGGDSDRLAELMTEDHVFVDVEGRATQGREALRPGWAGYFESYPDYEIHVSQVVVIDSVAIVIGQTAGSHVPLEVEALETVIWAAKVRGKLVAEWRVLYADTDKAKKLLEPGRDRQETGS
jgi:uncharacterized protein (TIGR02246 family)